MKSLKLLCLSGLMVLAVAVSAFAAAAVTEKVAPGQVFTGQGDTLAPWKGGDVCVPVTIHNASNTVATFNLHSSGRWFHKVGWKVVNSTTGADFIVQRMLGNNTTGIPGASGALTVNRQYPTMTLKPFGNGTSASVRACISRQ